MLASLIRVEPASHRLIGFTGSSYDITTRYVAIDIITLTIPRLLPKIQPLWWKETVTWLEKE